MERLSLEWRDWKLAACVVSVGAIIGGIRGWFTWEFEDVDF